MAPDVDAAAVSGRAAEAAEAEAGGGECDGGVTCRMRAETADNSARLDAAAECSDRRLYCGRKSPSSSYSSCNNRQYN